jgi:methylase of polypeptide subunit release factors
MSVTLPDDDRALLRLLELLERRAYAFVAPTPATHARVLARRDRARDLRDVLGWSLPFDRGDLDPEALALLKTAGAMEETPAGLKSRVRVSRLHGRLFLHSAYPTDDDRAVFFGPDSYRFADFIIGEARAANSVLEVGAGSGVGGIVAAHACGAIELLLTDVNPQALRLSRINAAHAGLTPARVQTTGLDGLDGGFDLIVANPPYIAGDDSQTYRDGGEMYGAALSLEWAQAAAGRLNPGGAFLLYTGAAIVGGEDRLRRELERLADTQGLAFDYREIDPDVFGEELERQAYAGVERIAAVGAVLSRPSTHG